MKFIIIYTTTLLLLVVVTSNNAQDVSLLLQNKQLVDQEIGCLMQRNPCDFIGNYLKRSMPEILSNCGRCSPQQAANARKLVEFMQTNYPSEYSTIAQIYGRRG